MESDRPDVCLRTDRSPIRCIDSRQLRNAEGPDSLPIPSEPQTISHTGSHLKSDSCQYRSACSAVRKAPRSAAFWPGALRKNPMFHLSSSTVPSQSPDVDIHFSYSSPVPFFVPSRCSGAAARGNRICRCSCSGFCIDNYCFFEIYTAHRPHLNLL